MANRREDRVQFSGVGRGEQGERSPPPHETEKIVVEIWCYLPEVILSEQRAEIVEKFRGKITKKVHFP